MCVAAVQFRMFALEAHASYIGGVYETKRDKCGFFIYWGCGRGSGNISEF